MEAVPEPPRWKLIYFIKGKRNVKLCKDPKKGLLAVKQLQEKGIKAHLVCRRFPKFPPKGEPEDPDMWWCPYCRRWRWFAVPRHIAVYRDLGIRVCKWCLISEQDFYVRRHNGLFDRSNRRGRGVGKKTRRKRRLEQAKQAVGR